MGVSGYETGHALVCAALRDVVAGAVSAGTGGVALRRVEHRACAALYSLLVAHPVDRYGRCRACRRSGLVRRRAVCRVYSVSHYWLTQPADLLGRHVSRELAPAPPADVEATVELPTLGPGAFAAQPGESQTCETPAAPPLPPMPRAGRPEPQHGGRGARPEPRRVHRGPDPTGADVVARGRSSLLVFGDRALPGPP